MLPREFEQSEAAAIVSYQAMKLMEQLQRTHVAASVNLTELHRAVEPISFTSLVRALDVFFRDSDQCFRTAMHQRCY